MSKVLKLRSLLSGESGMKPCAKIIKGKFREYDSVWLELRLG